MQIPMRPASANSSSSSSETEEVIEQPNILQKGRGIDATGSSPAAIIQRRGRSFSLPRPRVAMPRPFSGVKRHDNETNNYNDDLKNNNNNDDDEFEAVGKSVAEEVKDLNSNGDKKRISLFRPPKPSKRSLSRGKTIRQQVGDDKVENDYEVEDNDNYNDIRRQRGNSLRNSLSKRISRRQNQSQIGNDREEKEDVGEIEEVELGRVNLFLQCICVPVFIPYERKNLRCLLLHYIRSDDHKK